MSVTGCPGCRLRSPGTTDFILRSMSQSIEMLSRMSLSGRACARLDSSSGPYGISTFLLCNPVDLRNILGSELPVDRLGVLLDLLDPGGAGDHAGDLWPRRQPGERQFEHAVAARARKGLELFDE